MKIKTALFLTIFISLFSFSFSFSQTNQFASDSAIYLNLSGKIMINDSVLHNNIYFLDTNNNGKADYVLMFGPYWYAPDSSSAQRPSAGDMVNIYGIEMNSSVYGIPAIIVTKINNLFWRDPFDSFWNDMGKDSYMGRFQMGYCQGFAFGMNYDSLETVKLNGIVFADTTYIYHHYYLAINSDTIPNYFLNFGPPWYNPSTGLSRPVDGDSISVTGILMQTGGMKMIVVNTVDGKLWRDTSKYGFFGNWINSKYNGAQRINSPFDSSDWMEIMPGWNKSGGMHGGGMMMSDSLYGQMFELFPQEIPNTENQNAFAGYEIGMFSSDGGNMMWQNGGYGGQMDMNSSTNFQLHFTDFQLQSMNGNVGTIKVKYWNDQNSSWTEVSNAVVDHVSNIVTFSQPLISNYLILTADKITGTDNSNNKPVDNFNLAQNYPNPFNPSTSIKFELKNNVRVKLSIFNLLGQKIRTLIDKRMTAGTYSVKFHGNNLSSGIYFYRIEAGNFSKTMKMILMK